MVKTDWYEKTLSKNEAQVIQVQFLGDNPLKPGWLVLSNPDKNFTKDWARVIDYQRIALTIFSLD